MAFKYIVLAITHGTGKEAVVREWPVIFPDAMVHKEVADYMGMMLRRTDTKMLSCTPVAAGTIDLDTVDCYDRSETLKLESRGDVDVDLIGAFPYFHGIK